MLQLVKSQYYGFRLNGTLASNLKFSGTIRCTDIQHRLIRNAGEEDQPYWLICDEFGARMSVFTPALREDICIGERYAVRGDIKIGKGGTYLNLKEITPLNGSNFVEIDKE